MHLPSGNFDIKHKILRSHFFIQLLFFLNLFFALGDAWYILTTMTWRHSFRKIYCLDTLDTRFSIPGNVPPKHANTEFQEIPSIPNLSEERVTKSRPDGAPNQSLPDAKPSLWNTWEFYAYYFVFITCVPLMFKAVYDVSQRMHFISVLVVFADNMC